MKFCKASTKLLLLLSLQLARGCRSPTTDLGQAQSSDSLKTTASEASEVCLLEKEPNIGFLESLLGVVVTLESGKIPVESVFVGSSPKPFLFARALSLNPTLQANQALEKSQRIARALLLSLPLVGTLSVPPSLEKIGTALKSKDLPVNAQMFLDSFKETGKSSHKQRDIFALQVMILLEFLRTHNFSDFLSKNENPTTESYRNSLNALKNDWIGFTNARKRSSEVLLKAFFYPDSDFEAWEVLFALSRSTSIAEAAKPSDLGDPTKSPSAFRKISKTLLSRAPQFLAAENPQIKEELVQKWSELMNKNLANWGVPEEFLSQKGDELALADPSFLRQAFESLQTAEAPASEIERSLLNFGHLNSAPQDAATATAARELTAPPVILARHKGPAFWLDALGGRVGQIFDPRILPGEESRLQKLCSAPAAPANLAAPKNPSFLGGFRQAVLPDPSSGPTPLGLVSATSPNLKHYLVFFESFSQGIQK